MPEAQGHWWETLAALASFGAGLIAFLRGLQASKRVPSPSSDDYQSRLVQLEQRCARLEGAVIDQAEWMLRQQRAAQSPSATAAPAQSDLR